MFVDIREECESHVALLLTTMGCFGSLVDVVWYMCCNLSVDDLIDILW